MESLNSKLSSLNSMAYAISASIKRRADTVIGPYMPDGFSQL